MDPFDVAKDRSVTGSYVNDKMVGVQLRQNGSSVTSGGTLNQDGTYILNLRSNISISINDNIEIRGIDKDSKPVTSLLKVQLIDSSEPLSKYDTATYDTGNKYS